MEKKTFFQRLNDKDGVLNRKEFVIYYFAWWIICILVFTIIGLVFEAKSLNVFAVALSFGFFSIFVQRLRYFGFNKWWGLLAFPLITNPLLFLYLALKNKKRTD